MHGPVKENSIWGGRSAGWWPVTILATCNFCCFFFWPNMYKNVKKFSFFFKLNLPETNDENQWTSVFTISSEPVSISTKNKASFAVALPGIFNQ